MVLDRITRNPAVMGGKPCVRGLRVTVGISSDSSLRAIPRLRFLPHIAISKKRTSDRPLPMQPGVWKSSRFRFRQHEGPDRQERSMQISDATGRFLGLTGLSRVAWASCLLVN